VSKGTRINRLLWVTALLLFARSGLVAAADEVARIKGSFVQPWLADSWTPRQWERELQYMRQAGLDTLVLQWTTDSGNRTAVFPTAIAGYTQDTDSDVVESALDHADRGGMDVYLGLNIDDAWWSVSVHDRDWLMDSTRSGSELMDELWVRYGHHPSLRGWYIAFEPWNEALDAQALKNFVDGFGLLAEHAHRTTHLPVMLAPFYSDTDGQGPVDFARTWAVILRQVPIDILALQDGIGVGHTTVARLPAWFGAMRRAIAVSRPSTRLWSDTETFTGDDGRTLPINDIIADLRAVQPYVSNSLSFSFNHYLSPQQVDPLYDRTYLLWTHAGRRDTLPPLPGSGLVARPGAPLSIDLHWAPSTDNIGVVGYRIYRDGMQVATTAATPRVFTDTQLDPGSAHSYTFTAIDAAGNASIASGEAAATVPPTASYAVNLASGHPYSVDLPADPRYADGSGQELTDGVNGTTDFADPAWQGRLSDVPYAITIDLGSRQRIDEIGATWLQAMSAGIDLPAQLTYAVSDDGVSWTDVASIARPTVSAVDQTKRYLATALVGVAGRYVRAVVSSAGWSFIDEFEVRRQ
jgi:hypothetical protein